jgi:hypothetical protein
MTFTQQQLEAFFFDPVMAAKVLMNVDLDTFQRVRLKFLWFFPEMMDSSGVGTGKTVVQFVYLCLRCILIPDHYAAAYFPTSSIGQGVFWPKFAETEARSDIFRSQFYQGMRKQDDEKMNARSPGCWVRTFKNGSKIFLPAPDFKGDSANNASRDFNTVLIDEHLKAADKGDGIDMQLVDRGRRHCYNMKHPLWCNHIDFLGHAGSPSHKEYIRYRAMKEAVRDGNSRVALLTFCYLDWTPRFARKYREDNVIASQKRKLPRDAFRRQYLGLWTVDGEQFYPAGSLAHARRRDVRPMVRRIHPREMFFLGQDTAQPGASRKADFSAWSVLRVVELNGPDRANFTRMGRYFHVSGVFAHQLKNRTARQLSGMTFQLDAKFGFTGICMDPGGGGLMVVPEFREPMQLINNVMTEVVPLTTVDDPMQASRRGIVSMFGRKHLNDFLRSEPSGEWYLRGDEGLVQFFHEKYRDAWEGQEIHWPMAAMDRRQEVATWSREQQVAQYHLDLAASQLTNMRVLKREDGTTLRNGRGFLIFEVVKSKKDLAYAGLYAYAAFLKWLYDDTRLGGMQEPGGCFGAYSGGEVVAA